MAYGDFSFEDLTNKLGLTLLEDESLHPEAEPVSPSVHLSAWLDKYMPLATAINTEKARSELIILPMLLEARDQLGDRYGFFSGREFNVDKERGLVGVCDFLMSLSSEKFVIKAPLVVVVEAKNLDMVAGIPQCIAEMVAVQQFNQCAAVDIPSVHGIVSTGTNWRFLKLEGTTAWVDLREYLISDVSRILGVLCHILRKGQRDLAQRSGKGPQILLGQ